MEPDYSFEEGQGSAEDRGSGQYYRRTPGDTAVDPRMYDPRRPARRQNQSAGVVGHFARGVARIFALLFLAAGVGLWMVYFTVMYVFGLLGGGGMSPEDVGNDLMFGILSTLIALVLLLWSRSDKVS